MRQLLAEWRKEFDYIFIDSPPVLSVTDPVILSVEMDAVLLVIRSNQTKKAALRRAREILRHVNAPMLGIIVNGMDVSSSNYYYYYGSKHSGRYYHEA